MSEPITAIDAAVHSFMTYVALQWETELAFRCAYDQVSDQIDAEAFLERCQAAVAVADKTRQETQMHYTSFAAYVADVPTADMFRRTLASQSPLLIVRGEGLVNSLPGGYVWSTLAQDGDAFQVIVTDTCWSMTLTTASRYAALVAFEALPGLAPFAMRDLADHGYRADEAFG